MVVIETINLLLAAHATIWSSLISAAWNALNGRTLKYGVYYMSVNHSVKNSIALCMLCFVLEINNNCVQNIEVCNRCSLAPWANGQLTQLL